MYICIHHLCSGCWIFDCFLHSLLLATSTTWLLVHSSVLLAARQVAFLDRFSVSNRVGSHERELAEELTGWSQPLAAV
jgi:hypothetical protein